MRLLRLSWLLQLGTPGTAVHAEYAGVLCRRQELPEAAFISVSELKQITSTIQSVVANYNAVEPVFLDHVSDLSNWPKMNFSPSRRHWRRIMIVLLDYWWF